MNNDSATNIITAIFFYYAFKVSQDWLLEIFDSKLEKFHSKLKKFHSNLEKFHSKLEKFHSELEKFHSKLEKFHSKLEKFHSTYLLWNDRSPCRKYVKRSFSLNFLSSKL